MNALLQDQIERFLKKLAIDDNTLEYVTVKNTAAALLRLMEKDDYTALENILIYHETGGHIGDGSDAALKAAREQLTKLLARPEVIVDDHIYPEGALASFEDVLMHLNKDVFEVGDDFHSAKRVTLLGVIERVDFEAISAGFKLRTRVYSKLHGSYLSWEFLGDHNIGKHHNKTYWFKTSDYANAYLARGELR